MSTIAAKLTELRKKEVEIGVQLAALADKRKSYSLAAFEGDSTAVKEIANADFEADALKKTAATVGSALECAEALQRQQELEAEQQKKREIAIAAHTHARRLSH